MLEIVKYPDPVLRQTAEPIANVDNVILRLIDNMAEKMYASEGIGLAASQLGISKRVIVIDVGEGLLSFINPEIIKKEEKKETKDEGCLSLPGIRIDISRPIKITIKWLDNKGKLIQIEVDGLFARTLQHEIDHLNGILIIDYASSIQRALLRSKLKKMIK